MRIRFSSLTLLAIGGAAVACLEQDSPTYPNNGVLFAVVLQPDAINIAPAATQQLRVSALDLNTDTIAATGATFRSLDTTRVRVSSAGVVTGVAAGNTRVIATLTAGGVTRADSVLVTVSAGGATPLAGLTLAPRTLTLAPSCARSVTAAATNAGGTAIAGLSAPLYASRDSAIARVSAAGAVTAVAAGTTNIVATLTSGGVTRTDSVAVTVGAENGTRLVLVDSTGIAPNTVTAGIGCPVVFRNAFTKAVDITFTSTAPAPPVVRVGPIARNADGNTTFTAAGSYTFRSDSLGTIAARTGSVVVQ